MQKMWLLCALLIALLIAPCWANDKQDLEKELILLQERKGRLEAQWELNEMQLREAQQKYQAIIQKEKMEADRKAAEEGKKEAPKK